MHNLFSRFSERISATVYVQGLGKWGASLLLATARRIRFREQSRELEVKRASVDRCSPRLATLMNSVREVVATADRMSNAPSLKTETRTGQGTQGTQGTQGDE